MSWSRVPEWVTVHTLECCSCLNVGLKHTEWGKAAGRRLGREGLEKVDTGRGRREAQRVSYCHWIGGEGGFTLPDLLKKKKKKQKNPNTVSN